ncbi:MAG: acetyl-CoA carboxylase carboxyltransferase subunit, partial [Alphaproteobacteria bacterium]
RVAAGASRDDAKRDADKEAAEWLRAREAEFNARYEGELMNPREALSLGSISEIVDPADLRSVLARNLDFLIRHYEPGPMASVQREFH